MKNLICSARVEIVKLFVNCKVKQMSRRSFSLWFDLKPYLNMIATDS